VSRYTYLTSSQDKGDEMAKYAVTIAVDFGNAYDFDGAELQLNEELIEQLSKISLGSVIFNEITNAVAIKVTSNKESN
jgi:hypothetical protein